ncbi:hypothetical protein OIU78_011500 [Salix suchowensis]|nr:hypothetical protein OIU78_011500 [Salix suchowensis]
MEHLNKYGKRAKASVYWPFLGGNLSLLVHLMLLTRRVVKPSTLGPVVAFGSPFKSLYSLIGKLFMLQPDEKSSPPHPLLPPGSALHAFKKPNMGSLQVPSRQNLKMVRQVHEQRNQLRALLASPSPHSWNHENTLEKSVLGTKKVMTGG